MLETDLTIWMLDNPLFHTMESDPRQSFRDMYNSPKARIFSFSEWNEKDESNQATTDTSLVWQRGTTLEIKSGKSPSRMQLEEQFLILTCGHFLRVNDVLSEGFNTYLARMMDSGIVSKIFGQYYLNPGNYYNF